jgi:hypothetical protein
LEQKQAEELQSLHRQYLSIYESVMPLNLMKSALIKMTTSLVLKHNTVNTLIGLCTGYVSKKLLLGSTHNPMKKIAGTLLQFALTN